MGGRGPAYVRQHAPEPEPGDLSGATQAVPIVDHDNRLAIPAVTRGDLDDVVAWRASPQVARWWSPEATGDRGAERTTYAGGSTG